MILSSETNKVYFSTHLKSDYPELFQELKSALEQHGIDVDLLQDTADYWCRDYMPIQVDDDTYVKYKYFPDYLNKPTKRDYITDVNNPWSNLGMDDKRLIDLSDIIIDGGNVVKTPYHVIMTDKIYHENPQYADRKGELIWRLENAFQSELLVTPWHRSKDVCGHTDGMVRYIKNKDLLIGNFSNYASRIGKKVRSVLEEHGYVVHELPLPYDVLDSWAYINFLQTSKVILIPGLDLKTDIIALDYLQSLFNVPIIQILAPHIIRKYGGTFNCLSWNIKD